MDTGVAKLQREFFDGGNTKSLCFRSENLRLLKKAIQDNENEIIEALQKDLGKPLMEGYTSEIAIIYEEINLALKKLRRWTKSKRVGTPLSLFPSKSFIIPEPLGVVLIIGPWNYPFQLVIAPLIGAIAAGNCAMLMPSDNAPATAQILEKIINDYFNRNYISVLNGPGHIIGPQIMSEFRFDHIFFTGSEGVGKAVMKLAAEQLTPVTLELGGKSPAIVFEEADIKMAAKKIGWGRIFNAGQTCVAPDYVIVHNSKKEQLIKELKEVFKDFYGEPFANKNDYTSIINEKRFEKLITYLNDSTIIHGGTYDKSSLFIEPTIIECSDSNHPALTEEIFGPILPIVTYSDRDDIIQIVCKNRYPLACYIFTKKETNSQFILNNIEFGGGAINNTILHLANSSLPFGGVGTSGMGSYHGKRSFETFTHYKSMIKTSLFFDPPFLYPPYSSKKFKLIKWILKK